MWLCKFFSFFEKIPIISTMKWNKKGYLELWKKRIASFVWLDPCAGWICLRERKWKTELLCVIHKDGGIMIPKWRIKPWESTEDAALREFREETGIYTSILGEKIGVIRDRIRRKKITLYKIHHGSWQHTSVHDEAIMWIEIGQALKKIKHLSERKFIEKYL